MAAWKILLTDGLEENGQKLLKAAGEVDDKNGISADELLKVIGDYDALIVRGRTKVTPAVFDAGKKLKVVGRAGVGVDNIDLKAAKAHGVAVVNSPLATTVSVAELTMALMLALVREVPRADAAMKNGKWLKKELEGNELYQKTLGVIGFGRIGGAVAQRAAAFDMNVIAYDPVLKPEEIEARGGKPVSLEELLRQADFISLHVPMTESTRNMLNTDRFAQMKDGVYVLNASRGGVIDEQALLEALNTGKAAGAGLDVFAAEPAGASELVCHPHVVCTPHIGAQTVAAQQRAAHDIATEILAALKGEPLRWKVA